mmetsp:Transcript_8633/g.30619  ORF Transcript_8633/g.30619 Transcript_8633/m.30619 type:complete len:257 (+) Transcript_8633:1163-1933(+)
MCVGDTNVARRRMGSSPAASRPTNAHESSSVSVNEPVTSTSVSPAIDATCGETSVTCGAARISTSTGGLEKSTPLSVMVTPYVPDGKSGAVQATVMSSTKAAGTAASPKRHARSAVGANPAPVTVRSEPPPASARAGSTSATVGCGKKESGAPSASSEKSTPLLETVTTTSLCSRAGDSHMMSVDDTQRACTSSPPAPKRQRRPSTSAKPVPRTVTSVPPVVGTFDGSTTATRGSATYTAVAVSSEKSIPFVATDR